MKQLKKEKKIEGLPKWAREVHDKHCSWGKSCSDDRIIISPPCRGCGATDPESVGHKGSSYLCPNCWNKEMREIF